MTKALIRSRLRFKVYKAERPKGRRRQENEPHLGTPASLVRQDSLVAGQGFGILRAALRDFRRIIWSTVR